MNPDNEQNQNNNEGMEQVDINAKLEEIRQKQREEVISSTDNKGYEVHGDIVSSD